MQIAESIPINCSSLYDKTEKSKWLMPTQPRSLSNSVSKKTKI